MDTNLNSDSLLRQMEALKREDIESFYNLVFNSLLNFPEEAVQDPSPKGSKLRALDSIRVFFEEREEYEKCRFIKEIIDQIG